jgi:hypothetical protein
MCGTRSSLARSHKSRFEGENLKVRATPESNQKPERVKPRMRRRRCRAPTPALPRKREREKKAAPDERHFLLLRACDP